METNHGPSCPSQTCKRPHSRSGGSNLWSQYDVGHYTIIWCSTRTSKYTIGAGLLRLLPWPQHDTYIKPIFPWVTMKPAPGARPHAWGSSAFKPATISYFSSVSITDLFFPCPSFSSASYSCPSSYLLYPLPRLIGRTPFHITNAIQNWMF